MSDSTYLIYCEDKEISGLIESSIANIGIEVQTATERHGFEWLRPEIIVTGTTLLITILHAVIAVVKQVEKKTIRIKGKDGWEVEVPASMDKKDLENIIDSAKDKGQVSIIIPK